MEYTVVHPGSNAAVLARLLPGEKLRAEAGAMIARTTHLAIHGRAWGGLWRSFKRATLGGESFFFQEIAAERHAGDVLLAPAVPGDIKILPVDSGHDYYIQNGCLLAVFEDVQIDTKPQKLTPGLFSGAGFFVLHARGQGAIAVSAFGAVMEMYVPPDEKFVVDNGHVVAWSGDVSYNIVKSGVSWISTVTSGEGLACEFHGPGKVWSQTRNPRGFKQWIRNLVPNNGGALSLS